MTGTQRNNEFVAGLGSWPTLFPHRAYRLSATGDRYRLVDATTLKLLPGREFVIASPEYAFAYPSLATNSKGEVGLGFAYGGPANAERHRASRSSLAREYIAECGRRTWRARRLHGRTGRFSRQNYSPRAASPETPRTRPITGTTLSSVARLRKLSWRLRHQVTVALLRSAPS